MMKTALEGLLEEGVENVEEVDSEEEIEVASEETEKTEKIEEMIDNNKGIEKTDLTEKIDHSEEEEVVKEVVSTLIVKEKSSIQKVEVDTEVAIEEVTEKIDQPSE
jgi:hypothetical protein